MRRDLQTNIKVKLHTLDVLKKLKTNQEKHAAAYDEAREAYKKVCIDKASEELAKMKMGNGKKDFYFSMQAPVSHVRTYEQAIDMISKHTESQIELNTEQYNCLMRDDWDWRDSFYKSYNDYTGKSLD